MGVISTMSGLSGASVTYNSILFGKSNHPIEDYDLNLTPPQFQLKGRYRYDKSDREILGTDYTLLVSCQVYDDDIATLKKITKYIRSKLEHPRKQLWIQGFGLGFDYVHADLSWGPKPRECSFTPLGTNAYSLSWGVDFFVSSCTKMYNQTEGGNEGEVFDSGKILMSLSFESTWQNDFEGVPKRIISGSVEIPVYIDPRNSNRMKYTVDYVKDNLGIYLPPGFRRVTNVWKRNSSFDQIDFTVVDEFLPGTSPPEGCIHADADVTFRSQGVGLNKGAVTLNMNLRVSPSYPASLAGLIFLQAAQTKYQNMLAASNANSSVIVPTSLFIRNGKYDNARETQASMTWEVTNTISSMMLQAAGIWEPVTENSYDKWKTSISNLWGNRGALVGPDGRGVTESTDDSVVISVCDKLYYKEIGKLSYEGSNTQQKLNFGFSCPVIPPDGGWIGHQLKLRVLTDARSTWHEVLKEVQSNNYPSYPSQPKSKNTSSENQEIYDYELGGSTGNKVDISTPSTYYEYKGKPVQYVALQFMGLRMTHNPEVPTVESIGGYQAIEYTSHIEPPHVVFETPCPIYFVRGYRIYRLGGKISKVNLPGNKTSRQQGNTNKLNL